MYGPLLLRTISSLSLLVPLACSDSDPEAVPEGSTTAETMDSTGSTGDGLGTGEGTEDSSTGSQDSGSDDSTATTGPASCVPPTGDACVTPTTGARQRVEAADGLAYFVQVPEDASEATDVILFLPGGPGSEDVATTTWDRWLGSGDGIDDFIVVMPFVTSGTLVGNYELAIPVLDEVQGCYCNSGRAHLGGTSNGGSGAFSLMLPNSDRFVTLLGAPGVWSEPTGGDEVVTTALRDKAVFNGVGELDAQWYPLVQVTHEALVGYGIDSTFVQFDGEEHIVSPRFDETVFFDWWSRH